MKKLPWRPFVVGLLLALAVGYALRPTPERAGARGDTAVAAATAPDPATSPGTTPLPAAAPVPAAPAAAATPPGGGETAAPPASTANPLAPAGTLELTRAGFPAAGPVVVTLDLGAPSADDAPRPVRIFSFTDHRETTSELRLDAARTVGTLQIDPDFLRPGQYLVEVTTTERSAFPLRRYSLVVR